MKTLKTKHILLIIIFSTACNAVYSQKSETGNWFMYVGNQSLTKKFNWHNEIQYRNYDFAGDLQQLLLRTGIGYNLSENNNNLLFGYAFIRSERYVNNSDNKISSDEHRIYQQFISKQNIGVVFLQHRYRVEERFLKDDTQMRFRYFLSLNVPINHKTMAKNTVYLSAYNEIFVNGQSPLFDRNRIYGAVGYVFSKNFRLELGYMSQILENTHRNQFQILLFNNLSFLKMD